MELNQSQNQGSYNNQSFNQSEQDIQSYFTFDNILDSNNLRASQYSSNKILKAINILLNQGVLEIGFEQRKAQDLLDVKVNEEQIKLEEIKRKKQQIQKQLEYLKNQTSNKQSSNIQNLHFQNTIVLTKEQHKTYVTKIKKQRQGREKMHVQLLKKMQQKIQEQEQSEKKKNEEQKNRQIENRKREIEKKLMKNRQRYEQLLKNQRQSNQKIREIKEHKNAFKKIEEKHQKQIVLPLLQDKKQKLRQIREFRSLSIDEINQHQRKYLMQRRYEQTKRSEVKVGWSYQRPPKPERLSQILQFEKAEEIRREEEKKTIMESNLIKKENYLVLLRQNFQKRIKIDPAKRQELLQKMQKKQNDKINPDADLRKIGLSYLHQVGRRRRKRVQLQDKNTQELDLQKDLLQEEQRQLQKGLQPQQRAQTQKQMSRNTIKSGNQTKSKALTNYETTNHDKTFQKHRRKNIEKIMHQSQLTEAERIKMLKLQAQKIQQSFRMKQLELKYKKDQKMKDHNVQLLLSSIQAKIGIMQLYQ